MKKTRTCPMGKSRGKPVERNQKLASLTIKSTQLEKKGGRGKGSGFVRKGARPGPKKEKDQETTKGGGKGGWKKRRTLWGRRKKQEKNNYIFHLQKTSARRKRPGRPRSHWAKDEGGGLFLPWQGEQGRSEKERTLGGGGKPPGTQIQKKRLKINKENPEFMSAAAADTKKKGDIRPATAVPSKGDLKREKHPTEKTKHGKGVT